MNVNNQNKFEMDLHHITNLIRSADIHLNENSFNGNMNALEAIYGNVAVALEKAETMAERYNEILCDYNLQANILAEKAEDAKADTQIIEGFISKLVKSCGVPVDEQNEKRVIEKVVQDLINVAN